MSIINNGLLLASGADAAVGYQISRSLRFNAGDSAYLSRTPGSAGNRRTWTFSCWVKRSAFGALNSIFGANSNGLTAYFNTDNTLNFYNFSGGFQFNFVTTQVFRDPGAWMHLVFAVDTTQATSTDRVKIYVNGSQITQFSTASYPSQNLDTGWNSTAAHNIGYAAVGSDYFNGYIADIYALDGTATTPSTFAETDAVTGQWVPKTPTGISYGTNGFHLTFSDNSGTTSTTLGNDVAGSNDFTPNNFSVASGAGNDSLVDSPTSYGTDTGAGGEVRGNYATLNPLSAGPNAVLANGNLDWSTTQTGSFLAQSTIAMSSGKWYCEYTATSANNMVGVQRAAGTVSTDYVGGNADSWGYYGGNGNKYNNNSSSSYGASYTTSDVVGIALDVDAGTLTFYKNGTSQGQAYSGLTNGPYTFVTGNGANVSGTFNFGARAFSYQAPSGFKALCDTNLTAPVVAKPSTVFDTVLWTGNSASSRAITMPDTSNSPDLVWVKDRTVNGNFHNLFDVVRGAGVRLVSNNTDAESSNSIYGYLSSFDSNGFTLAKGSTSADNVNQTGSSYVAWCWDAGSSNATNTSGTITSTVRANATAGFSIVTYTTTGSASTIGHGLGVAPSLIITKQRNGTTAWYSYHASIGANNYLLLNSTAASAASSGIWNNTAPTSTVFTVGSGFGNGETYVAYAFSPVSGYSSAFSYNGNQSEDGPMVFLGFRPRWIIIKSSTQNDSWYVYDTARSTYNQVQQFLNSANSAAEDTGSINFSKMDILSNGFKVRANQASGINASGQTYVGFAFAESPFQYARAR